MEKSIDLVRGAVASIAKGLGLKSPEFLVRSAASSDGGVYVKVENGKYWLIAEERGVEVSRECFDDLYEVVYLIIKGVLSAEAIAYELEHRVKGQDFRRVLFAHWVERTGSVSKDYGDRIKFDVANILKESPFVDDRVL